MPTTDFFKQCFAYVHNWASYLKIISRWLYLALFAGILSGCTQQDLNYVKYGVGVSVSDANIEEISSLQSQYFTSLCIAAVNSGSIDYSSQCPPAPGDERIWTLIVQQGLNDIDRRCDGYLEWLDIQRRRREPDLRMVNSILGRTIAAIGLGWPSTVANPRPNTLLAINLVTQAFGLLTDGMENYHSRMLMAAEPSTISSVVFHDRDRFRQETYDFVYTGRPAAEYALRRYLHICMPFTIEAQINDRTTQSTLGITPNRSNSLLQTPQSVPIVGAAPISARVKVFNPNRGKGTNKKPIIDRIDTAVQEALCIRGGNIDGIKGPRTTEAIRIYQYADIGRSAVSGILLEQQEDRIISIKGCNPGFRNYLERRDFNNDLGNAVALGQLREDLNSLATHHSAEVTIGDGDTLETLRPKIAKIKEQIGGSVFKTAENETYLNQQWTPDLVEELREIE